MADLQWQTQRVNYTAAIADEKAEVAFGFTNTGDRPVTIESVRTSCGCTTAKLDKQTCQHPPEVGPRKPRKFSRTPEVGPWK